MKNKIHAIVIFQSIKSKKIMKELASEEDDMCKFDEDFENPEVRIEHMLDELVYIGGWKNEKPHGCGIIKSKDNKITYKGRWKNGELHGYGILKYEENNKTFTYEGGWKNGQKWGYGVLDTDTSGISTTYSGIWDEKGVKGSAIDHYGKRDGYLIYDSSLIRDGYKIQWDDWEKSYHGHMHTNMKIYDGSMTYTCTDGRICTENYKDGVKDSIIICTSNGKRSSNIWHHGTNKYKIWKKS